MKTLSMEADPDALLKCFEKPGYSRIRGQTQGAFNSMHNRDK